MGYFFDELEVPPPPLTLLNVFFKKNEIFNLDSSGPHILMFYFISNKGAESKAFRLSVGSIDEYNNQACLRIIYIYIYIYIYICVYITIYNIKIH